MLKHQTESGRFFCNVIQNVNQYRVLAYLGDTSIPRPGHENRGAPAPGRAARRVPPTRTGGPQIYT